MKTLADAKNLSDVHQVAIEYAKRELRILKGESVHSSSSTVISERNSQKIKDKEGN